MWGPRSVYNSIGKALNGWILDIVRVYVGCVVLGVYSMTMRRKLSNCISFFFT